MSTMRAILQLMLTPGLGSKTLADILLRAAHGRIDPEHLADAPLTDLVQVYRLRPAVASAVAEQREQAAALADQLDEREIELVSIGDPRYPQRLRKALERNAPPILFAHGNLGLLDMPAIAFGGSRQARPESLVATRSAASALAAAGLNVVSGYANGVDLTAHTAAVEAGGVTTLVLAEGILHFRVKGEFAEHMSSTNHLILSEFPPTLRWIARNAMQRNGTVIGLSRALLIVESGEDGGTFAAGMEAIEKRLRLFVLRYAHTTPPGNETLIRRGGHPVSVDESGHVDLSAVLDHCLSAPDKPGRAGLQQDTLF